MAREKLHDRRRSRLINFQQDQCKYIVLYSLYPDGRLAEIFLDVNHPAKPGDQIDLMAKDLATLMSIALQHGISADEIMVSLSQERDGTMRGPLGKALAIIKEELKEDQP
jgi:hypothetical protein